MRPCSSLAVAKLAFVIHHVVQLRIVVGIHVVCNYKVYTTGLFQLLDFVEKFKQCLAVHPVVTVAHAEIQSRCVCHALIDSFAVTAVRLMHYFYDVGILCRIAVGNYARVVLASVIDDDNLHAVSTDKEAFDTFGHVVRRIVTGNRYCK